MIVIMQSEIDYYAVLHLKPDSSFDEIRRQYRRLAKVYHPDRNPGEEDWCAEQLTEVNKAYECLSNRERRAAYDKSIGRQPAHTGANPGHAHHSKPHQQQSPGPQQQAPRPQQRTPPTPQRPTQAAASYAINRVRGREQRTVPKPTGRQIAIVLLGGGGVGLLGAFLSMALFSYLNPAQNRHTVLPTATLYESDTSHSSPSRDSGHRSTERHRQHYRASGTEARAKKHISNGGDRQSEAERLNHLGIQVPANEFSKQELHDMALRLQKYDSSH